MTMSMMSKLPVDLIEEIMCRVPATSLKRLRSTCKLWNSLFQDKRFASKHLDKSAKQFLGLMLINKSGIYPVSVDVYGADPVTGELSLMAPSSSSIQLEINSVLHCEGLLLCTNVDKTGVVVWNPCTGETVWIQPRDFYHKSTCYYALGSFKLENNCISYKILCYSTADNFFEIYNMNSNSWWILDVIPDCNLICHNLCKSLRGKTYWLASDDKDKGIGLFLVSFDYTTKRFERLHLPGQYHYYETNLSLSVIREEKLCVLVKDITTSITEIWVTNKIGETKAVTWIRLLALDLKSVLISMLGVTFLVDEEKKVLVCSSIYGLNGKKAAYIVGEDNNIRQVDYEFGPYRSYLINYVPRLSQIQQAVGLKRKRGE